MIKRELRLSMNSGLTELLALLCFSLLSYQRVPTLLFKISLFVLNRLQNQIPFHKILYQLYILLAFMPETSPMLWALAYVDKKMMNGIVALHLPPMRKDAVEKNGTLFRSVGCVGSRITSELFTLKFKHVGTKCYMLRSNRSLLMLLRRRFFAFSSLWTGALVDTGRERVQRVVRNGKKDTTTSPLCWTADANTVVSDQDQESIRIWILTCQWFLTLGILPGSWWDYHELDRGGWWFRDPVENASFMPRLLATARIHSVILPLLHSWTSFLNIVTFPCCVSGTFSIRSRLLAPVHSFARDDTRGIFLLRFFLLMTGISMILFSQMKQ